MKRFLPWLVTVLCLYLPALSAGQFQLVSTESDPDSFIQGCVNVINGDYCESSTDLTITGPDALVLQRFYSTRNVITGEQAGGWKIFPQRFLVIGKELKSFNIDKEQLEWVLAFVGERSGGILPYTGWRNTNGSTEDPLTIDALNTALGMVNTYAKDINGQTNHLNNKLHCKGDTCELTLGDGTKRIYNRVQALPSQLLGEELIASMAAKVLDPACFLLIQETLPSGNQLFFSYNERKHLSAVELKNPSGKLLSWIRFSYEFEENKSQVYITTSDSRELIYQFLANQLTYVSGTHSIPIAYEYNGDLLVKKVLPEGRFVEIKYQNNKVQTLHGPHAQTGKSEIVHSFSYGQGYTEVFDAMGVKTRYLYDQRYQLTAVEQYDNLDKLYRSEQKFWGNTKSDGGFLLAKAIGDGEGRIHSYRSLTYDKAGNVTEERLYGNLTGKREVSLQISAAGKLLNIDDEECHVKTYGYSTDGFNLLTKMGDCKGNQTHYSYKSKTNLLTRKLIYYNGKLIKNRMFQHFNEDGVCVKIVEDDSINETESGTAYLKERHIKEIRPKTELPGVGLPETILEKAFDLTTKKTILVKKQVNTFDLQSNLVSCDHFDANDEYAFTEKKSYTPIGKVASQTDAIGREVFYTYDEVGNETFCNKPYENRSISINYDFHNKPVQFIETTPDEIITLYATYDVLGRKIASVDRFGQATIYEYDSFHRLIKVIHPEVLEENGQAVHPTFRYTYDIFGNALSITDPKGFIIKRSYNLRGDPTKIFYPDGSYELFKYDAEGSLHRSLSREQLITVYEYDYLGRPSYEETSSVKEIGTATSIKSKSYQYNGFRCIREKDDYCTKKYSFDPAGRLITVQEYGKDQDENSLDTRLSEFTYDSFGRIQQKKVWFGTGSRDYSRECLSYDLAGNVIERRVEGATNKILLQKFYVFNLQGQCEEEYSLENGIKTTLVKTNYNYQGEPISFIDGQGQETKVIINNEYLNDLGQAVVKKVLIDPLGIQTEMEFDALGRLFALSKKDPYGTLLSSRKQFYDLLGYIVLEIHDQIVKGEIIGSHKTQWVYGPMGRLEEEIQAVGSSLCQKTYYAYNSLGRLISKSRSGNDFQYTYNHTGAITKIESPNGKIKISYEHDLVGNIITARTQDDKSIHRDYNHFNQVVKETIQDGQGEAYALEYAYDRKGRLNAITLPDQSKISYVYDAVFGREVNRISPQGNTLYAHSYESYDSQGRLLVENCIREGGGHEYSYNLNGQKIAHKNDFFNEEYTRDVLGRITEIKGEKPQHYHYNDLSQLISENKFVHAYDSLHNRIQTNNEELTYNGLNQLVAHANAEFSYDSQGNLLRKVLEGEETCFESNALCQLNRVEKAGQTALTFSYDPFGRLLVEQHVDTTNKQVLSTIRYFYLGNQEIGTLSSKGTIESLKIPGLQGDKISPLSIAFEIKGETYIPIHDVAGNVSRIVDPTTCQTVESYEYTAFGQVTIFNAAGEQEDASLVDNPWQFAEKRINKKSGLILFGLRFYDPMTGRWISQDPIGVLDGPNLYAYLQNNPINHFDRFGLTTETKSQNQFEKYIYGECENQSYCEKLRNSKRGGDIGKTAGYSLPKITYDDYFEKYYKDYRSEDLFIKDCYDNSICYDLSEDGLSNLPNNLGIGFINGIWNDFKSSKAGAQYVSRLAGGYNVHAVYNATHGGGVDLMECLMGLNYIATEPVKQLHAMWNSFFEESSGNAKFLMICHSQGAIHVRNALLDYPPELRERILVVAIAPAAYIYQETCAKVIHYQAEFVRDCVPRVDVAGAIREKGNIVTLPSLPGAPAFDHEFMSPTYRKKIQEHIQFYIENGDM